MICPNSVFRNGDEKYRGARVLLPRKIMGSWERVLELVTEKANLITPAKRICTLDGRTIHSVSEIQDGGKYVAMEGSKSFQRVAYCATNERRTTLMRYVWDHKVAHLKVTVLYLVFRTVPRAAIRLRRKTENQAGAEVDKRPAEASLPSVPTIKGPTMRRKSIRPMAGRKNKEGRERAIMDHREVKHLCSINF